MAERLQKVIAEAGIASRRKAEKMIVAGRVKVDGHVVTKLGTKVDTFSNITVDDEPIERESLHTYLFYKPRGVVSTAEDDRGRKTVVDYFEDLPYRLYPVGRLDYDTTGLILLTNDGDFANVLMHPSYEIEKTYIAKINKILSKEDINKIKKGIKVENRAVDVKKIKIKKIDKEKNSMIVEVTIVEGRNHIIKKLFKELGVEVLKLSRIGYGFLDVKDLKSGEYRKLTIKEIKKLYALAKK